MIFYETFFGNVVIGGKDGKIYFEKFIDNALPLRENTILVNSGVKISGEKNATIFNSKSRFQKCAVLYFDQVTPSLDSNNDSFL